MRSSIFKSLKESRKQSLKTIALGVALILRLKLAHTPSPFQLKGREAEKEEEEAGEEEEKGQREEEGEEAGRRVTTNRGTRKEPETRGYPGERCFAGAKVRDCFKREGTKAGDECYPAAKHSKD